MIRNVLILCTGNSARSIMAEALINHRFPGQWRAYSAGSHPTGTVNPLSLAVLAEQGVATTGLRSKSWDEFTHAPVMDLVITVCDNAAGEVCPLWPGAPRKLHWGFADPAAATGRDEQRLEFFRQIMAQIDTKIGELTAWA